MADKDRIYANDIIYEGGFYSNTRDEFLKRSEKLIDLTKKYGNDNYNEGFFTRFIVTIKGFRTTKRICEECGEEYYGRIDNPLNYCDECYPKHIVLQENVEVNNAN